ncbi:MAG: aspartate kinase [Candidatus Carbobacillus altaicus]|uniref:Aspartokinase n=1 Tax=Candidatus Carbonibacillus altaicus TaxID=2163959 RepID=A0A2R6XXB0_9BACL|nr:aspartate kinase [Candidatus Carbobacillus altaicus]PTQ55057.1 MAG: Aspartokinase [Candidatus Carbobacillus altaicus]
MLVVQKYGGSSLATVDHLKTVAEKIMKDRARGLNLVIVTSAMGKTTDELLKLAYAVHPEPEKRELDCLLSTGEMVSAALLALKLLERGVKARALTGAQAGMLTDDRHSEATPLALHAERLKTLLADGVIPVITGFQGMTIGGEITTLGRGGSDTSAAYLAYALGAARVEIYTDVEAIYDKDPRRTPEAVKYSELSYEQALELAENGAKVLHPAAIRWAMRGRVPLLVAHYASRAPYSEGTWVTDVPANIAAMRTTTMVESNMLSKEINS